jgi:hypothetical protein
MSQQGKMKFVLDRALADVNSKQPLDNKGSSHPINNVHQKSSKKKNNVHQKQNGGLGSLKK